MTFHAKWTPIRYNVIYAIDPQYPADKTSGTMRNSQFTFDKVDDRLTANAYRVSGNDFIWWEGIDANGKMIGYFDIYDEYDSIEFSLSLKICKFLKQMYILK